MDLNNIYGVDRKLVLRLEQLNRAEEITKGGKDAIKDFLEDLASQGISEYRQLSYLDHLLPFAQSIRKAFLKPSKAQVKKAVAVIERSPLSEWSKVNKKVAIKRFYKWKLGKDEDYPAAVKWIKTTVSNSNRKLPEDLLTPEEVKAVIDGAINPRDKALISLLADGGLRIGEALNLRIKDFHPDEYGGYLMVQGKTGARRVRLIDSVPRLSAWIDNHPLKENGEAPVFIQLGGKNRGQPLKYHAARKAIREAAQRGGVELSKVNPHNFRHTRATDLAKKVPEAPLEKQMGWVHGSKMSKTYVHLSGIDVDEAILGTRGIKIRGDEEEMPEVPRNCPRCAASNPPDSEFCRRCGMALTERAALEDPRINQAADFANTLSDVFDILSDRMSVLVGYLSPEDRERFEAGRPEAEEKVAKVLGKAGILGPGGE